MERKLASDIAQIYAMWNEYVAAREDDDIERWMALWSEDGRQMAPDSPQCIGRQHIRAAMAPFFQMFTTSNLKINIEEVKVTGTWAYSHGTYTYSLTPKAGGEQSSFSGKFLDILQRQPDGCWKIAIDCHNASDSSEIQKPFSVGESAV